MSERSGVHVFGAEETIHCPVDTFDFRPYFTDGACPLCGWPPDGLAIARPWTHRVDWAVVAFAALVSASVAMITAVLLA